MKTFLFLLLTALALPSMAHYQCEGLCKYYAHGVLSSSTVYGSGESQSSALSDMRYSCSDYCTEYTYKDCTTVSSSCSSPEHFSSFSESLGANNFQVLN